jgi:type IV secretory pathway ATPase VirB11/archaellum biosynthesis ATPase
LLVDRVGHAQPRLKPILRRLREAVGHTVIQTLQVGELRELGDRLVGRTIARQHDAIEAVAAFHKSSRTIDDRRGGGIVELRQE